MRKMLLALALCVLGCDDPVRVTGSKITRDGHWGASDKIEEIEYDGCQYLVVRIPAGGWAITHKGNCKRCLERAQPIQAEKR